MVGRRAKRRVRLHLQTGVALDRGGRIVEVPGVTLEGILAGHRRGHYVLWEPAVLEGPEQTIGIQGHAEVPEARVLFVQVIN